MKVVKRNGIKETYDKQKIFDAVSKAMVGSGSQIDYGLASLVAHKVEYNVFNDYEEKIDVETIHRLVENSLMDLNEYDLAREYITYRDNHKPDIFRKRVAIKPYEYPELLDYVDAIRHSYWIHTEFNYSPDIQDIKVNMSQSDVQIVTRAMLAISQIESAVKTFWGKVGDHLPKPEISKVGATFSESEVRHEDAYSHLIELLGLNSEFEKLSNNSAMRGRIKYLNKVNRFKDSEDPKDYFESIILFSILIENISLFSQFLIIMSYNKHESMLKGISNAVEATSKEENLHAMFGADLVNIIRQENPDWWDADLENQINEICLEAYEAELDIIEWMYAGVDSTIIPKRVAINYLQSRFNKSLAMIGMGSMFIEHQQDVLEYEWFDEEINVSKNYDFFNKRSTAYSKKQQSITAGDLF